MNQTSDEELFNVHVHLTNVRRDVPVLRLIVWLLDSVTVFRGSGRRDLTNYIDALKNRLKHYIDMIRKTPKGLLQELKDNYQNKSTRFAVLSLDLRKILIIRKPIRDFKCQLKELQQLLMEDENDFMPFVCIDPRNYKNSDELLEFLKQWIGEEKPFWGVKLYPSLGYYPWDPKLMKMYEYLQENKTPMTAHCSQGVILFLGRRKLMHKYILNPFDEFIDAIPQIHNISTQLTQTQLRNEIDTLKSDIFSKYNFTPYAYNNENWPLHNYNTSRIFLDPQNYEIILKLFPNLKLNLAHFGGYKAVLKAINPSTKNWFNQISDMIKNDRNNRLYTDFAANWLDNQSCCVYDQVFLGELTKNSKLEDFLLMGSDFHVNQVLQTTETNYEINIRQKVTQSQWKKISVENPKKFLRSKFQTI